MFYHRLADIVERCQVRENLWPSMTIIRPAMKSQMFSQREQLGESAMKETLRSVQEQEEQARIGN